jgi:hypothetical protein
VLRPGGRLVGSAIVPGGRRGRLIVQPNRGGFGPVASAEQLQAWMAAAGLEVTMNRRNTFAYFNGRS